MKKIRYAVIVLSLTVCFCSGCTDYTLRRNPSKSEENISQQITISNADELANYIKYYYYNQGIQEGTHENHYLLDKNFKLTRSYRRLSSNYHPFYPEGAVPEGVMIEELPNSVTYINHDGDFYSRGVGVGCVSSPHNEYYLEEQSLERLYKKDTYTCYEISTCDRHRFDTYPQFVEHQRAWKDKKQWTFATADEFNTAKNQATGIVVSYLGITLMFDLFKVIRSYETDTIPHIVAEKFEKLDISQNGDVVSFDIVYVDESISSVAKGTLNVSKIDFQYEYSEIRREADIASVVESEYSFELVALADGYTIDFDTDQQF